MMIMRIITSSDLVQEVQKDTSRAGKRLDQHDGPRLGEQGVVLDGVVELAGLGERGVLQLPLPETAIPQRAARQIRGREGVLRPQGVGEPRRVPRLALRLQPQPGIVDALDDIRQQHGGEVPVARDQDVPGLDAGREGVVVRDAVEREGAVGAVPVLADAERVLDGGLDVVRAGAAVDEVPQAGDLAEEEHLDGRGVGERLGGFRVGTRPAGDLAALGLPPCGTFVAEVVVEEEVSPQVLLPRRLRRWVIPRCQIPAVEVDAAVLFRVVRSLVFFLLRDGGGDGAVLVRDDQGALVHGGRERVEHDAEPEEEVERLVVVGLEQFRLWLCRFVALSASVRRTRELERSGSSATHVVALHVCSLLEPLSRGNLPLETGQLVTVGVHLPDSGLEKLRRLIRVEQLVQLRPSRCPVAATTGSPLLARTAAAAPGIHHLDVLRDVQGALRQGEDDVGEDDAERLDAGRVVQGLERLVPQGLLDGRPGIARRGRGDAAHEVRRAVSPPGAAVGRLRPLGREGHDGGVEGAGDGALLGGRQVAAADRRVRAVQPADSSADPVRPVGAPFVLHGGHLQARPRPLHALAQAAAVGAVPLRQPARERVLHAVVVDTEQVLGDGRAGVVLGEVQVLGGDGEATCGCRVASNGI